MYWIEISYSKKLKFADFDDFMAAIGLLMAGGLNNLEIGCVSEERNESTGSD